MKLFILAVNKDNACVRKETKCRFCHMQRGLGHMEKFHPEKVAAFAKDMRDLGRKEMQGYRDMVEYTPKWHRYGNRI
jgi:hypothetical protein